MNKFEILVTYTKQLSKKYGVNLNKIRVSKRMSTAFGRFRATQCRVSGKITFSEIIFSEKLLKNQSMLMCMNTARHEIAHALTPGDGHGFKWLGACEKLKVLKTEQSLKLEEF